MFKNEIMEVIANHPNALFDMNLWGHRGGHGVCRIVKVSEDVRNGKTVYEVEHLERDGDGETLQYSIVKGWRPLQARQILRVMSCDKTLEEWAISQAESEKKSARKMRAAEEYKNEAIKRTVCILAKCDEEQRAKIMSVEKDICHYSMYLELGDDIYGWIVALNKLSIKQLEQLHDLLALGEWYMNSEYVNNKTQTYHSPRPRPLYNDHDDNDHLTTAL